jgi:hypothetical protein
MGFTQGPERVSEGNWEWYRAAGFRPYQTLSQELVERLPRMPQSQKPAVLLRRRFGIDNVVQGDVFDPESDRPLRHIPGMTVYVRRPSEHPEQSGKARPRPER